MVINYHISPYPSLHENMVAKIYEASSPNAEVQSFTILEKDGSGTPTVGAGHQVPNSISFTGCDMVVHVVRLFTASGSLLHWYDVQPTIDVVTVFDPIYFKIGDGESLTPLEGTNTITNPAFIGSTAFDLSVFVEGQGFLHPNVDYSVSYTSLFISGQVFEANQRWRIFKKPSVITTYVNDSVVGKGFGGFIDVVADIDYIPGHLRKLIRLSGTGHYTFPLATPVPIGYNHHFTQLGNEATAPKIKFLNGTLLYGATPKSELDIPFGSTVCLTWDGVHWNLTINGIKAGISAPVAGDIVGNGSFHIGDISAAGADTFVTITHGFGLAYAYIVLATFKGTNASKYNDNNCGWSLYDYQPNSFKFAGQEFSTGVQDITLDYVLIKV